MVIGVYFDSLLSLAAPASTSWLVFSHWCHSSTRMITQHHTYECQRVCVSVPRCLVLLYTGTHCTPPPPLLRQLWNVNFHCQHQGIHRVQEDFTRTWHHAWYWAGPWPPPLYPVLSCQHHKYFQIQISTRSQYIPDQHRSQLAAPPKHGTGNTCSMWHVTMRCPDN